MLKIAVFGFYGPDQARVSRNEKDTHISPVNTDDFMRTVWQMEPPETRIGAGNDAPCFVKLTALTETPVYVQSLRDRMAPGAAMLNCQGYIAIIDAVKILAPKTIESALRRLAEHQPVAHLMIAAARQNEPEALSSDEIREVLGLHRDQPIYPYIPNEPKTVQRMVRRLVRYINDPERPVPPVFADQIIASSEPAEVEAIPVEEPAVEARPPAVPRIYGLGGVAITVSDLGRALDFYRGLLGFRMVGQLDVAGSQRGLVITHLDTGSGILELFSFASGDVVAPEEPAEIPQTGLRHISVRVSDLDAVAEQLACAEVPFTLEPSRVAGGMRAAFVKDPDGTPIALLEGEITYTRR